MQPAVPDSARIVMCGRSCVARAVYLPARVTVHLPPDGLPAASAAGAGGDGGTAGVVVGDGWCRRWLVAVQWCGVVLSMCRHHYGHYDCPSPAQVQGRPLNDQMEKPLLNTDLNCKRVCKFVVRGDGHRTEWMCFSNTYN